MVESTEQLGRELCFVLEKDSNQAWIFSATDRTNVVEVYSFVSIVSINIKKQNQ
jgi:hypothetical protein